MSRQMTQSSSLKARHVRTKRWENAKADTRKLGPALRNFIGGGGGLLLGI